MSRASIAVVIPTIPGREQQLAQALASVEAQHRKPDQVVVELDTERSGAAATRNRALERVETDLIAWLDDDDLLLRNHLGALERAIEGVDLVYPRPRMLGGQDPTAVCVRGVWSKPWGIRWGLPLEWHLRHRGSFIPITHMVRTKLVRRAGGFPEGRFVDGRYSGEDEQYLIALLDAGARFRHLDAVTWQWRVWDGHTAGKGAPA